MLKMDEIQKRLLEEIADLHDIPAGAYNLRANGESAGRRSTANIEILSKKDVSGLDINIKDGTVNLDWHALARPRQTVVFYMGIGAAEEICRQMMSHGERFTYDQLNKAARIAEKRDA